MADLLREFDVDLHAGLAAADPDAFLAELDQWARTQWPSVHVSTFSASPEAWLPLRKEGEHIVLAMLMDVAIALGQVVIDKRPGYDWRLDLAKQNRNRDSYRRVVVARALEDPLWTEMSVDFEAQCIYDFHTIGRGLASGRTLGYSAQVAISGGYDAYTASREASVPRQVATGPHAYDKAKNHVNSLQEDQGFTSEQANEQAPVLGAFFLGWLASRGLLSPRQAKNARREVDSYLEHRHTAVDLYRFFDYSLIDDMLAAEANAFARSYFDSSSGYYADLTSLAQDLPSYFHVPYTFENQARIDAILDERYAQWKADHLSH